MGQGGLNWSLLCHPSHWLLPGTCEWLRKKKRLVRKDMFFADHMQEGTRKRPGNKDDEERVLVRFTRFGHPEFISAPGDLDFPLKLPQLQWKTLRPPTTRLRKRGRNGEPIALSVFPPLSQGI